MGKGRSGVGAKSGGNLKSAGSQMSASDVLEIIQQDEYEYYGIRIDDGRDYAVGDIAEPSRVWADGELTGETLDGTSTVGIRSRNMSEQEIERLIEEASENYFGNDIFLLASNRMTYGEDAVS